MFPDTGIAGFPALQGKTEKAPSHFRNIFRCIYPEFVSGNMMALWREVRYDLRHKRFIRPWKKCINERVLKMKKVLILLAVVLTVFSVASSIHPAAFVAERNGKDITIVAEGEDDPNDKLNHKGDADVSCYSA